MGGILQAVSQLAVHTTPDQKSVVISWSGTGGQLEQAVSLAGPYYPVSGATNPYTWTIAGSSSFFRLAPLTGGGIHGYLFAQVGTNPPLVFLPDIHVYLHNTGTGLDSAPVVTDDNGRYVFPIEPSGTYQLRWHAQLGWAAGQSTNQIVVGNGTEFPLPAQVVAATTNGVIYGQVTFQDGNSPWFEDDLFGINTNASITVLNTSGTKILAGPVHANSTGWYAVAGVPRGANVTVSATSEAATTNLSVQQGQISFGGTVAATYIQLPNSKPQVLAITPMLNGLPVHTAPGGTTIELDAEAQDADSNQLDFTWAAMPGEGSLASTNGSSVQWTLPMVAGKYWVYLLVSDGLGGYAQQRVDFRVDETNTFFSGLALDGVTGEPVAGALVSVNETNTTTTLTNGSFFMSVPLTNRYVYNIVQPGYAQFSRVVYNYEGEMGQTWKLIPAQAQMVDPTQPIVLVDQRPGVTNGVTVRVPANALVDSLGNPPLGMLTAYLVTYDPTAGLTPGDWSAQLTNGQEAVLNSYGAGYVEFMDEIGTEYNLAPGTTAEVDIIPPATMLTDPPTNAMMFSYDDTDGYWKQSGCAYFNSTNGTYVGHVPHFSAFDAGLANEYFGSGCLSVLLDPPLGPGATLVLQFSYPTDDEGDTANQSITTVLGDPLSVVYNLPPGASGTVALEQWDGTPINNFVVLPQGNSFNIGSVAVQATGPPPPPYNGCTFIELQMTSLPANEDSFLTIAGQGTDAQANGYYATVDPQQLRDTLGGWWYANGFTQFDPNTGWPLDRYAPGGDFYVFRTAFLNNNDLGSGRDMFFRLGNNGQIAAMVVNYGKFDQNPANADLAAQQQNPGAVVCMECSPIEGQGNTPVVKFFVYFTLNGIPVAESPRAVWADLDGFGPKYVPNLCLNCHGGSYRPANPAAPTLAEVNVGGSFLALDTSTYKFPQMQTTPNASEETNFFLQNITAMGGIAILSPPIPCTTQAVRDLINGWYANINQSSPPAQDNTWTPSGWTGSPQPGLYHTVIAESCRTCHVAQGSDINWTSYDQLDDVWPMLVGYVLCPQNNPSPMPQSLITYRNFWLSNSPNESTYLRNALPMLNGYCP